MAKVLVTGGAGFIGSHLTEALLRRGDDVTVLDNFNTFYDPDLKRRNLADVEKTGSFRLVEGDIRDREMVMGLFRDSGFDVIVHLAAMAGVRPSIADPALYVSVNLDGTTVLLDAAVAHGKPRFVFASSSSVYGNNKKVPFSEDDPVDHPISPYAATKKAGELVAHTYHHIHQLDVSCLRFFTVYGPRQRPEMAIHKFARMIEKDEPLPFFGDGSSRRDYTYIDDIIDGVVKSVDHCKGFRVYNLGESRTTNLDRLVQLLESALGKKAHLERLPFQPGDVQETFADVTRAKSELGYAPGVPVEDGIPRFVTWLRGGDA